MNAQEFVTPTHRPRKRTTASMVEYLLRVSTGTAPMDSGGKDGRAWQRARFRDFKNEPRAVVNFKYDIEYTKSTYHHLVDHLTFEPEEDAAYQRWAKKQDDYDLTLMAAWVEKLEKKYGKLGGFYGDGKPDIVNTYNGECALDRTLQFQYWSYPYNADKLYLLLQVHGGADVRGGYTHPMVFSCDMDSGFLNVADGEIRCSHDDEHVWSTDDHYHWYFQGACGRGADEQLETYKWQALPVEEAIETVWKSGILFYDADGKGYCPKCGCELEAR